MPGCSRLRRRAFLAAGASMLGVAKGAGTQSLPAVTIGNKSFSRLIVGGNPIGGFAHNTKRVSELMLQYFTVERTTQLILDCEKKGINTWQSSYSEKVRDALAAARERGSKMQFVCLTSVKQLDILKDVLAMKPVAICHHGNVTDDLIRTGQQQVVHDYVKRVHDQGILAGVSTHNPDNVARMEDWGWENDLYMTCFYYLSRTPEEIAKIAGGKMLGELYLESDPLRMTERIRQVRKPCLAFKILAAGRLCTSPATVERAFAFAYKNIKPSDAAIVGMWPVIFDEVSEDVRLAGKYARPV